MIICSRKYRVVQDSMDEEELCYGGMLEGIEQ